MNIINKNITPYPVKTTLHRYNQQSSQCCNKEVVFTSLYKNKTLNRKVATMLFAANCALFGLCKCVQTPYQEQEKIDGINVEYINVNDDTKQEILKPVINLEKKLTNENNFLKNINFTIVDNCDNLTDTVSFFKCIQQQPDFDSYGGVSFYSDKKLAKRIVIQESAFKENKIINFFKTGEYSSINSMKQAIMHEVGHQFDEYFGHNHNAPFAQQWDSVMYAHEQDKNFDYYLMPNNYNDAKISLTYDWNAGLSDKKAFLDATLKDYQNIQKFKKDGSFVFPRNIDYYTNNIDFKEEITTKIIDFAEHNRKEIYAQLFSYALGENDGDKENFIKCFPNTYKVVCNDVETFLNIQLTK